MISKSRVVSSGQLIVFFDKWSRAVVGSGEGDMVECYAFLRVMWSYRTT